MASADTLVMPPPGAPEPRAPHNAEWVDIYRTPDGDVAFYEYRMPPKGDGDRKWFLPKSWDGEQAKWVSKAWPDYRPLLGCEMLSDKEGEQVLIVEGSKAWRAAKKLVPPGVIVLTWSGGGKAVRKSAWEILQGRSVIIWPDADPSGTAAAQEILNRLQGVAKKAQILVPESSRPKGWDAHDALHINKWTPVDFTMWAKGQAQAIDLPDAPVSDPISGPESSMFQMADALDLQQGQNGPKKNITNAARVIEGVDTLRGRVWYDEFHFKIFTDWRRVGYPTEWTDIETLELTRYIQEKTGIDFSKDTVDDAVTMAAHRNVRNEPKEWLESLEWDGTKRLDTMLPTYWGAEQSEYAAAAGRNFMRSMVARVFRPGCKVDSMLVLEGEQGNRKSTSLQILGGRWYAELMEKMDSKDFFMAIQGKMLVEMGEMDAMNYSTLERVKQVITCQRDRFREPYGRRASDHDRQCVFAGTTNKTDYLKDVTGGRRFWPVTTGTIDTDALVRDRDQLFAEAVSQVCVYGAAWHEMPAMDTEAQQSERRSADPWESFIEDWLNANPFLETLTTIQIVEDALGLKPAQVKRNDRGRIADCLDALGWKRSTVRINGKPESRFIRK